MDEYFDDSTTSGGAATPPTTVWNPSVDGDTSVDGETRASEGQTKFLTGSRTIYETESEHPPRSMSHVLIERIISIYRTVMRRVDYLGRILVVLLIAYLVMYILGFQHPIQTATYPLSPLDKMSQFLPSSSSPGSSIPLPDHTYILRSKSNGKTLNRRDGYVLLINPGTEGSSHWECVQTDNWVGFRDTAFPYAYLGHNSNNNLEVKATTQKAWEKFELQSSSGGYRLQMVHSLFFQPDVLWYVGLKGGNLAKISDRTQDSIIWEFFEV